ncbi:MAG: hypothetical protein WC518_02475 [Patescibacteria group bacterium]
MIKKYRLLLTALVIFGGAILASPVFAFGSLVKSADGPAVYYLDGNNFRHTFPTESTYKSWYDDFSEVNTLTAKQLAQYPLNKNVTVRPGIRIVTFQTDNNFYAVEPGGVLRLFKDEGIIKEIYGSRWEKRLVRLPDAFFPDYSLGEPISSPDQLPAGLVYKSTSSQGYYYIEKGLFRPFKDLQSIFANKFKTSDIVSGDASFDQRRREINGFTKTVFNPVAAPVKNTADCENKKFKVAFILVAKENYSPEQVDKINLIKDRLAKNFKLASSDLAEVDVSYPLTILSDDPWLLFTDFDGQKKPDNEVINTFYDKNQDDLDFIILYNNFVLNEPVTAKYLMLTNDFLGTGQPRMHSAYNFGSQGKLKGIANMGNVEKYSVDSNDDLDRAVGYISHELLHHFSGKAKFLDDSGQENKILLTSPNYDHWSRYLDAVSPLGGSGWRDNSNGTFTSKVYLSGGSGLTKFSNLDLYFMGLLPKFLVGPIRYFVPDNYNDVDNTMRGKMQEVSLDKIVDNMGQWRCQLK